MTNTLKSIITASALVVAGAAFAQGTPPNAAVKDPAVGAGQQSTQTTPMGTTGTPAGSGSATMGSTGTTSGTTSGSATMGSTTTDTTTGSSGTMRTARADRN